MQYVAFVAIRCISRHGAVAILHALLPNWGLLIRSGTTWRVSCIRISMSACRCITSCPLLSVRGH